MSQSRVLSVSIRFFILCVLTASGTWLHAADVWNSPAFSVEPAALRAAANAIPAAKDTEATLLLNEVRFSFDAQGRTLRTTHTILRIETQEAVEDWSEVRAGWQPWYQATPEIRARVITADGAAHMLDPKTLSDVPENEDSPDTFSDTRAYGGPLPAIAPGAIVEEEIVLRDTTVFFAAGDNSRVFLNRSVPVTLIRIIVAHPVTFPVRYEMHLLPDAKVAKSESGGTETITIENGPLEAISDRTSFAPPEIAVRPQVEISTGHSWREVAAEYARQSEAKLRVTDVQPAVARLGLKAGSGLDAIRKIVSYLHSTVRYTGVEFGEASLVPQFPAETLKRKYGDCKDKSALLIAMLRAAGIPANMALLSSGPGQDVNPEMPGMGMFDHAIVYVPAASSGPELWIDATAQYNSVGSLPSGDYDRWALIVDSGTTALQKIPALTSAQNVHRELREVTLAEFGPAKFVERNEQTGSAEVSYREFHSGEPKKLRENLENYFKNAYASDSAPAIEKTDPSDLQQPFVVTFTGKGKRGFTYLNEAVVYIADGAIFTGLPDYFSEQESEEKKEAEAAKKAPRTLDWAVDPFVSEWHYKIVAPLGFKVRALPSGQDVKMGPARLTEKFSASADGATAEAVLRFDSGQARFTADEGRLMRDAIVKHLAADLSAITFDHIGHALLVEGRTREALDAYRSLTVQHPKEALHKVQMANALLTAGLAERARVVAREATLLDPGSAQAFNMLGWTLQHDLIGRNLQAGFDYEGALAAYRRAKQLDPKDQDFRANLATLLEYDPDGIRYSEKAHLKEALVEFREFKGLDEEFGRKYDDFILYDLFYTGQYKELREAVPALAGSETRKGLLLAAIAATDGVDAAMKKSLEVTTGSADRGKALVNAGWMMLRRLRYREAAELLAAGSAGRPDESKIAPMVVVLKKLPRHEDVRIDDSAPTGALLRMLDFIFRGTLEATQAGEIFSTLARMNDNDEFSAKDLKQGRASIRATAESASLPPEALTDIIFTSAHFNTEGDDRLGYKVNMETIGAAAQQAYVLREDGRYKIAALVGGASKIPEHVGWVVIARLEAHDLEGARKWLDWAREDVHNNKGDDPLSGQPFPAFWTRGQQGDEAAARRAALVLVPSRQLTGPHLTALIGFRDQASSQSERNSLNVVLAWAWSAQRRWQELVPVAQDLMKAEPDSLAAFNFATTAYAGMKDFDSWEKLVHERLEKHPGDPDYIRSAAQLNRYRGEIVKERELLKGLMDRGKATSGDLNWYSWEALFLPQPVGQESIDAAQRASDLTKRSDFGVLHTLACLYAEQGKTAKARELLLQAMESTKMTEPDSAIWLGFGMIAEQYGEIEAAKTMYGRVEKLKNEVPGSNYSVAQLHLARLSGTKR